MPTAAHCVGVNLTSVAMSLDSCARLESGTHDPETFTDLCSQQLDFVSSPAINPGQVFFTAMNRTGFKFDHCHIFPSGVQILLLTLRVRRSNRKPRLLYVHGCDGQVVVGFHLLPNAHCDCRAAWLFLRSDRC